MTLKSTCVFDTRDLIYYYYYNTYNMIASFSHRVNFRSIVLSLQQRGRPYHCFRTYPKLSVYTIIIIIIVFFKPYSAVNLMIKAFGISFLTADIQQRKTLNPFMMDT